MRSQADKSTLHLRFLLAFLLFPIFCVAQQSTVQQSTVLAGIVTDATGKPVANAHVSARTAQAGPQSGPTVHVEMSWREQ